MARYLAVAHQTSESEEFVEAVREKARLDPEAEFVLLVPATPVRHLGTWTEGESQAVASRKAQAASERLAEAGIGVAEARVGDPDPFVAVMSALSGGGFDEIVVSTFPPGVSRWLGNDLINRLRKAVDLPLTHVVAG